VTLTETEINRTKLDWQNFILTVPNYPSNKFSGRGIVSSASSGFDRRRLVAAIKLLRWLKCRLPVEVFMHSEELKYDEIRELQGISDVTVRILREKVALTNRTPSRFAIKPGAILQSSFEHVLWLDSDNIAVRDPEYLFDLPHYTRSTAIFWPDFWSASGKNVIWKILDVPCRAEDYEQESGQILINKRLAWKALNLAAYLISDHTILKLIYGDKDTFRLSWKVMGTSFYFIRKFAALGGFDYVKSEDKDKLQKKSNFCGHTIIQHDPFGDILFLHANLVTSHPLTKFPAEKAHSPLTKYVNPWHVYRRYANSAPYFRPLLFVESSYYCMTFLTGENKYLPPLFEDEFHNQVSPDITAKYLSYLNGTIMKSTVYGIIDVVERNWTID
jgi:alpha 1,2-mannosyltransferase